MTLACIWFVALMVLSYGITYTSLAEIRHPGDLPGSPIALFFSGLAISVTWDEIGGVAASYIWNLFLPHGQGSSLSLFTAAFMTGMAGLIVLIAPYVCALMWHKHVKQRVVRDAV